MTRKVYPANHPGPFEGPVLKVTEAYYNQLREAERCQVALHHKLIAAGFTCIGDCYTAPPGMTKEQLEDLFK
jgi:hypothetical protein